MPRESCYVVIEHTDPQNDGDGRVSLPVVGVFDTMEQARKATGHDDTTIFVFDHDEALELVEDFEHDVKRATHGMWCHTCSSTVVSYKDSVERFECPNQPEVEI